VDRPDRVDNTYQRKPKVTGIRINALMRNQYVLGYSSGNPRNDGAYRKVEVRLKQPAKAPRLGVSWRTGYYSPDYTR
jgi:hypothetical protein